MDLCPRCASSDIHPYEYRHGAWRKIPQPEGWLKARNKPLPTDSDRYRFDLSACFRGLRKSAHVCVATCSLSGWLCRNCRILITKHSP